MLIELFEHEYKYIMKCFNELLPKYCCEIEKTLYIDDLCVDENKRGQHLGSKLYNYVKDYAKENNYYNLTLNVWELNEPAMKFYQKMGLLPQKTTIIYV